MLTPKQKELLMFIHERLKESGVPPSFDEMKEALDLRSKSGIHRLITALEERGFVRRLPHRARAMEIIKLPESVPQGIAARGRGFSPSVIEGSLGRAYLAFVESQQLSADGLVAASEEAPRGGERTAEENWLGNRLRDIHDLQHVLCGYGRDELGELCLLAFMNAQTPSRGIAFIIFMGRRTFRQQAPHIDVDACVEEGRRTGEAARWFATVNWEQRLAQPLDALRAELGIAKPVRYRNAVNIRPMDASAAA